MADTSRLDHIERIGRAAVVAPVLRNAERERELVTEGHVALDTPTLEEDRDVDKIIAKAAADNFDKRLKRVSKDAGYSKEGYNDEAVVQKPKVENKMFRPRGNIAMIFYDKREIVGLAGPAGTGKSRGILEKLHLIAEKYPNCRILICRKTRESLSEAALFTYEAMVLPVGHPCLDGAKRSHRQSYEYPNGSSINVAGLDKPQKIMSTEYDIIYVQEAIECEESDFDFLGTRLRNGVVPYQQLLFDCNPDSPSHWLYQNALSGKYIMYDTEHEDNPRWFETAPHTTTAPNYEFPHQSKISSLIGRWTDAGLKYIARLDGLSGARKLRLRYGKWAASEGQIYDNFNATIHLRDHFNPPNGVGHWVWTVDFGWAKPFCLQMWWIDTDGRAYLWREIYHTQKLVEEHAAEALDIAGWGYSPDIGHYKLNDRAYVADLPHTIVCDHDAEGRATLETHLHLRTEPATKAILEGIDATKARFKIAGDGKPRVIFMRGTVLTEDKELKEQKQPLSTVQEIDSYVWEKPKSGQKVKDRPIDEFNHGMDALRYLVCHLDGVTGGNDPRAKDVPNMSSASSLVTKVNVRTGADRVASDGDDDYGDNVVEKYRDFLAEKYGQGRGSRGKMRDSVSGLGSKSVGMTRREKVSRRRGYF